MTIVETTRPVTGGVDTQLDVHVAAAVDANGGVLGVESFATTPAGYRELCSWLVGFGTPTRVGVKAPGTVSVVIEVDRPNRQERRRNGKSDSSTRSKRPGRRCRVVPQGSRSPPMETSKRSARYGSESPRGLQGVELGELRPCRGTGRWSARRLALRRCVHQSERAIGFAQPEFTRGADACVVHRFVGRGVGCRRSAADTAIGLELVGWALVSAHALSFILDRRAGHGSTDQTSALRRAIFAQRFDVSVLAISGATSLAKHGGGLYWLLPAVAGSLLGGGTSAWLFLISDS